VARDGASTSIALSPRQVSHINQMRAVAAATAPRPVDVSSGARSAVINKMGLRGLRGPPGVNASGAVAPIDFTYGDASSAIYTPGQAGTITLARVDVQTSFDGAGAQLKLGTVASPESILAAAQNDPSTVGEFENTPDVHLSSTDSVFLTIVPGAGATQGSGSVLLTFIPD
jgi:hypothetical protein